MSSTLPFRVAVLAIATATASAVATKIHVDDDAAPGGDGSIASPFDTIQAGLDSAAGGDTVLVDDGLYRGEGNRDLDFGGRSLTLMSLGGRGACTIDADHPDDGSLQFRCFVFDDGETGDAVVQGFTLDGFYNVELARPCEGGLVLITDGTPRFVDCFFDGGAGHFGTGDCQGGAVSLHVPGTQFHDCVFESTVFGTDGAFGGAVHGDGVFVDCVFDASASSFCGSEGGAIFGTATALRCTFTDCSAGGAGSCGGVGWGEGGAVKGGGTYMHCTFTNNRTGADAASPHAYGGAGVGGTYTACVFTGNWASAGGGDGPALGGAVRSALLRNCLLVDNFTLGGMVSRGGGAESSSLFNCTLVGNLIDTPLGVSSGAAASGGTLVNCVISGSPDPIGGGAAVTWSLVPGGVPGAGNIAGPAVFVDAAAGDYRLAARSPGIDAGNNGALPVDVTTDLAGMPRYVNDPGAPDTGLGTSPLIDMGAYERQVAGCPGDVDGDGEIDVDDLNAVIVEWGVIGKSAADVNGDAVVDVNDLNIVIVAWGPCP